MRTGQTAAAGVASHLRFRLSIVLCCLFHMLLFVFFFFSSRRRHTRCYRDWSSDVCSSDLRDATVTGVQTCALPILVVGAPDHDVARPLRGMPHRMREPAGDPLEIGKNPVAPLVVQAAEGGPEEMA